MEHGAGGASVFPNFLLVQLTISMSSTSCCLGTEQESPSSWQVSLDGKRPVQLHHGWFANVNEKMVTASPTSIKSIMVIYRQFHQVLMCAGLWSPQICMQKLAKTMMWCLLGCADFYIYKTCFSSQPVIQLWYIINFYMSLSLFYADDTGLFVSFPPDNIMALWHSSAHLVNISTWWEKNNSFSTASPSTCGHFYKFWIHFFIFFKM